MTIRILCVEDEPGLREDLSLELDDAGYAVALAANGGAALALLAAERFDLVLCDVQMPGLTGVQLLEAARDAGQDCPFLMLTAYSGQTLKDQCIALGASDVLVKPVDYARLLDTIAALVPQA